MSSETPNTTLPVSISQTIELRVRYSETDQMGTFYNSRPLEWFECGRTELLRSIGLPYVELEARGVFLPLAESHVEYLGRARYDDLLRMTTGCAFLGRARLRCDNSLVNAATGKAVARGYTVHAFTDPSGRVMRPPAWFVDALARAAHGGCGGIQQAG
jgi:acyl-CoA thioester hydrolase